MKLRLLLPLLGLCLLLTLPVAAQDTTTPISDDDVNAVAHQMYCPVCENVPLDVCPTLACAQWRAEIREQLTAGLTVEQIQADFVRRYGQQVLGTPQDPALRALSLATPWIAAALALAIGVWVFIRWNRTPPGGSAAPPLDVDELEAAYRTRVEQDLLARR
jgi:cytochrome c-type biogenesis protein CcmH